MERQEAIDILAEGRGGAISGPTMQSVFPWHEAGQGDILNVDASQCMGSAATIGLGLALAQPSRKVMVLDGDGSLLMQLGSLVTVVASGVNNLYHFVFANGLNQSTGNQPERPSASNFSTLNEEDQKTVLAEEGEKEVAKRAKDLGHELSSEEMTEAYEAVSARLAKGD